MGIQRRIIKSFILFLGDVAVFYAALFLMLAVRYRPDVFSHYVKIHIIPFSIIFGIWLIVFYVAGLYELRAVKNSPAFYDRFYKTFLLNAVVAILVFYLAPYFQITPRMNLFITLVLAFILLLTFRWSAQGVMAARGASRVLFFGFSKEVTELADFLKQNPQLGYLPMAVMTWGTEETPENLPLKVFSFDHHLTHIVEDLGIEVIVASSEIKTNAALVNMLFQVVPVGIPVVDFLSFYESATGKIPVSQIGEVWFLENLIGIRKPAYEFLKRAVDIAAALLLGLPALPLMPVIACAVYLDTPGQVFYRQKRVGRHGRIMKITKFRSMYVGAESSGARWADKNDPRVTRVGRFLRKSRLDELPQLWNVLKGDLSLIGPRPERPEFVELLTKEIPFYQMRHLAKPGLSGWAQINFPYGASVEDALEKLQYELAYIKNRSVWLDLTIALRTIVILVSREGR
ncbi:MAG: sugar transferase [Candidatus Sungiibacteriota bacterium]